MSEDKNNKKQDKADKKSMKNQKAADKKIAELEEQIKDLQVEREDLLAKLQRVSADYSNYQRRAPRQIADSVTYEKNSMIKKLLGSIDNFDHALAGSDSVDDVQSFVKGVRIVYEHFLDTLRSMGVHQIKTVGEEFDPSKHEAMMRRSEPDKPDGTVLEEFQKGYMLEERVLRPAKVIVNKHEQAESQPQPSGEEENNGDEQKQDDNPEQN